MVANLTIAASADARGASTFTGERCSPRTWRSLLPPTKAAALALFFVTVVVPISIVALQIDRNPALSAADEFAHLDYVVRLNKGELPVTGDRLDPRTLRIEACVGIDYAPKPNIPPCNVKKLDASAFPDFGFNHEAQQPPLYYGVTAAYRALAERLTGDHDFLQVARLGGMGWFVAGLILTWIAGRLLGAPTWALIAALLVLSAAPAVEYYSSIVSNDAAALFAGALVLTAAAVVGTRPTWRGSAALAACGGVVAALKPTNGLAVIVVAIYLVVQLVRQGSRGWQLVRRWTRSGGALIAGTAVVMVAWVAISGRLATMDGADLPIYQARHLRGLHLDLLLEQASSLFNPATGAVPAGTLTHQMQLFNTELISILFIVSMFLGVFVARRAWFDVLGPAGAVGLLLTGFGYGVIVLTTLSMDPGTGSRYGLAVLPMLTIVLACLADRARVVWLVGAVGVMSVTTTLFVLATS